MALADVLERITQDGDEVIRGIEQDTERAVQEMQKNARTEQDAMAKEAENTRARHCVKIRERILADARRRARFLREQHMQDAIQHVSTAVRERIAHMEQTAYKEYIQHTLATMGTHASRAAYTLTPERAEETRDLLIAHGIPAEHITVGTTSGLLGGYIASTATRTYTSTLAQYAEQILRMSQTAIVEHIIKK
jgi:vacuolar-type H+-ATPase subunit E/Vma4